MKTAKLFGICAALFAGALPARSQINTFEDLNFESANLSNPTGSIPQVPIASALPGWRASINDVPVTQIWANAYSGGAAAIDVLGPTLNSLVPGIIDGNYTVFLQAFNPAQGDVALWQNGTIPANDQSLEFKAWSYLPNTAIFTVSFAGNSLSPVVLSSGQSSAGQPCNVYGTSKFSQLTSPAYMLTWDE